VHECGVSEAGGQTQAVAMGGRCPLEHAVRVGDNVAGFCWSGLVHGHHSIKTRLKRSDLSGLVCQVVKSAAYAGVMPAKQSRAKFSYPVFLNLEGVVVLVVGGGRIGARKAEGLVAGGASVRLVATEVSDHVDRSIMAEVREKPFDDDDLDGVRLVVTATGDFDVDQQISAAARAREIWTNAADQPVDCEWILPAIARSGRVTGAISTDGASPALAGYLRDRLAEILDDRVAEIADILAAERRAVQASGESTEDIDWKPRLRELFAE
jgi:precorrin-2 dehydrogenase/sirohydrochlorin ferrochelatase